MIIHSSQHHRRRAQGRLAGLATDWIFIV